jgi:O-antigen/teichoic acid export membrane protein
VLLRNGVKFIRFRPFDVTTSEGRSNERYRMVIWSFFANVVSKTSALGVMLLGIHWTLPYLGAERFGVWMTVASLTTMLLVLDFGVGSALTNHVAHSAAKENPDKLKKTISGSLGVLFIVALVTSSILFLVTWLSPVQDLVKVNDQNLRPEIRQTLLVFAILFGVNIFSSGVQKLFLGMQRTFEGYVASSLCSLTSLFLLWWVARQGASVPQLLAVSLGVQSLSGYILCIVLIKRKLFSLSYLRLNIKGECRKLFKKSSVFFFLQIGVLLGWGADSIIISSTLGVAYVAVYSVTHRLFQLTIMSLHMINGPLWGAYADASARGDKTFIRATLRNSMRLTTVISIVTLLLLLLCADFLVKLLSSNNIYVPTTLLMAFVFWTFLECTVGAYNIFLNGVNIVKPQLVAVVIFVIISLLCKLLFIEKYGIIVVPLATGIAYIISITISYRLIYFKHIKKHYI